jgi:DNA-binding CsgD family transcriptional regulator
VVRLGDSQQAPRLRCRALITLLWLRLSTGELAAETKRIEQGLSVARSEGDDASTAEFLQFKVWNGFTHGDPSPRVSAMAHEAIELARRTRDRHLIGRILAMAGTCMQAAHGQYLEEAVINVSEAVEIFRECGDHHWLGHALNNLASMRLSIGERAAARGNLAEAVELSSQLQGDSHLLCLLYLNAGLLALVDGRLDEARASFLGSFTVANRIGDLEAEAVLIVGMAMHLSALGYDRRAASMHGLSVALLEQIGQVITPDDARLVDPDREALRERMGSDAFEAALLLGAQQAGTWWDKDPESRAIIIFGEGEPVLKTGQEATRKTGDPTSPRLSDRERELLGLLAGGLTDKQIAEKMFISIRTVRSHLDRIRDKTGCRRRADLTRLADQLRIDR